MKKYNLSQIMENAWETYKLPLINSGKYQRTILENLVTIWLLKL